MTEAPHILFLYGDDEYAIARRIGEFASMFKDQTEAEMNTSRLDARTMTDEQWANAVNVLPFLAKQRLVLLSNPSARFARRRAKADAAGEARGESDPDGQKAEAESAAEARKKFLASLAAVPESTRLVMSELVELRTKQDRMAAEKHWLTTWMRKNGQKAELLTQPAADSMAGWISREARQQGGAIAVDGARRLAEMVGTDTRQAAQEVTKLLTYVNWERPVTAADVEALSPLTAAPEVFQMVDAMAEGRAREAQGLLHRMLEHQDEFSAWAMIIRQFRYLLVAREVLDGGGGEAQVVQALTEVEGRPVQAFVAGKAMRQARGFTAAKLDTIYHRLLEIDADAKTGRMPLDVALDLLLAELGG